MDVRARSPMPAVDSEFCGYRIVGRVAQGGAGTVYRASRAGRDVALKLIASRAEERDRFEVEVASLRALRGAPNVVEYLDHGVNETWFWLATEWLDGQTLAGELRGAGCTLARAQTIGIGICSALAALHGAGYVHRDLKPSNIFCCEGGGIKLLDFGIVENSGAPLRGWAPGTPAYMAPEQARGVGVVDARSDLFALGSILFECVTGRPAFSAAGRAETLARVVLQDAPRVGELRADVPEQFERLIASLQSKQPDDRFLSASATCAALERLVLTSSGAATRRVGAMLSTSEQRVLSIVAVRASGQSDDVTELEPDAAEPAARGTLQRIADEHQAQLETLADGTSLLVLTDVRARPLVQRAVACAETCRASSDARVAVATGRARWDGRWPVGDTVDAALKLLADDRDSTPRRDALTETLLRIGEGAQPNRFVGRRAELRRMVRLLRAVRDGARRHDVVVAAAAGQGKSALIDAFVRVIRGTRVAPRVLRHRAEARERRVPWQTVRQLLRQVHDADIAAHVGDRAVWAALEAPAGASNIAPEDFATRLAQLVEEVLGALTGTAPLVIVVDDVHWCDGGSLRLLTRLRVPALFVFASRPDVPELLETAPRLALGPLDERNARRLYALCGGTDATADALAQAAGSPLLLEVLARAPQQLLLESTTAADVTRVLLQLRLGALGESARRVARAASVFGLTCPVAALHTLLGAAVGPGELSRGITELAEERVVSWADAAQPTFVHDNWRAAAYALLTEEDRLAGHRVVGGWLAERDAEPALVAAHFRDGRADTEAARWYVRAADRAHQLGDLSAAEAHYDAVDAERLDVQVRGELRGIGASIALWRGELERAQRAAAAALGDLAADDPRWARAAGVAVQSAGRLSDRGALDTLSQRLGSDPRYLFVRCQVARELVRMGDYAAVERALERIEPQLPDADDKVRAEYASLCAAQAVHGGAYERVVDHWQAALACYERLGDRMTACATRGELGFAYYLLGDLERARAATERARSEAAAASYGHIEAWLWCNLGIVLFELERYDDAMAAQTEAIERLREIDDPRLTGSALAWRSVLCTERGELDAGLSAADQACQLLEAFPPMHGLALASRAQAQWAQGKRDAAQATVDAGCALVDRLGALEEGEMLLEMTAFVVLSRSNRQAEARRRVGRARSRLERRSAGISDRAARQVFLTGHRARRTLLRFAAGEHEPSQSEMPWAFMRR